MRNEVPFGARPVVTYTVLPAGRVIASSAFTAPRNGSRAASPIFTLMPDVTLSRVQLVMVIGFFKRFDVLMMMYSFFGSVSFALPADKVTSFVYAESAAVSASLVRKLK